MCKVLPAPYRARPPAPHTLARRERAAAKQKPLPPAEQVRRAEANREAHRRRYPSAPYIDPLSQVRGDPRLRDEPAPRRPAPRDFTLADIVYAFDVTGAIRLKLDRMRSQKRAATAA
jgi:hypothetical protein